MKICTFIVGMSALAEKNLPPTLRNGRSGQARGGSRGVLGVHGLLWTSASADIAGANQAGAHAHLYAIARVNLSP